MTNNNAQTHLLVSNVKLKVDHRKGKVEMVLNEGISN